jgi:hypothetical protein
LNNEVERYPSFRWVVLAVAWLAMVGMGWVLLVITPLMAAQTPAAYDVGFLASVLLIAAGGLVILVLRETGTRAMAMKKATKITL